MDNNKNIDEIKTDIHRILYILNGNGEPGLVAKVASLEEKSKEGRDFGTFLFRTIIGILVSFIALKVGLTH